MCSNLKGLSVIALSKSYEMAPFNDMKGVPVAAAVAFSSSVSKASSVDGSTSSIGSARGATGDTAVAAAPVTFLRPLATANNCSEKCRLKHD